MTMTLEMIGQLLSKIIIDSSRLFFGSLKATIFLFSSITNALNESQLIDARRAFYDTLTEEDSPFYSRPVDYGLRIRGTLHYLYQLRTLTGQEEGYMDANSPRLQGSEEGGALTPFPAELMLNEPPLTYITHLIYLSNSLKSY
ncbi:unnamed protein product [Rhizopus stolonifer]